VKSYDVCLELWVPVTAHNENDAANLALFIATAIAGNPKEIIIHGIEEREDYAL